MEAARELLSDALPGVAVEVAASHTASRPVLQARVPRSTRQWRLPAKSFGKLPVAFGRSLQPRVAAA